MIQRASPATARPVGVSRPSTSTSSWNSDRRAVDCSHRDRWRRSGRSRSLRLRRPGRRSGAGRRGARRSGSDRPGPRRASGRRYPDDGRSRWTTVGVVGTSHRGDDQHRREGPDGVSSPSPGHAGTRYRPPSRGDEGRSGRRLARWCGAADACRSRRVGCRAILVVGRTRQPSTRDSCSRTAARIASPLSSGTNSISLAASSGRCNPSLERTDPGGDFVLVESIDHMPASEIRVVGPQPPHNRLISH